MRSRFYIMGVALLVSSFTSFAAEPATVNGKPIKQSLLDYIVKDLSARGQQVDDNMKAQIVNKLVSTELLAQEALKAGFDKQPDYIAREELMERELLVNMYLQDYTKKHVVEDAAIKAEYDKMKAQMGDKEFKASHILVKTEQEAKDVIAQLGKGGDFAKLAKDKSVDPGSKEKGGDLGWFPPAAMVKSFSDAVSALQKGKYTLTPVQTQYGWHIIRLEDTRASQPPAFDKVKDEIRNSLQKQQLEKLIGELRAKAKIVENLTAKDTAKK